MADYATVFAEALKLSPEDQQKLAKAIAAQFKKPRAAKAVEEGAEPKPKRVLTDEQKAKMKAGREAAKTKRDAEKAAVGEEPKPKRAPKAAEEGAEKPKRVLTDEQKAKMKAGREAAKARKAAEASAKAAADEAGGVPALAAAPAEYESESEEEVELIDWEHDFGEGMQTYKRLNHDGMVYIFTTEKEYLGAYVEKTNKLKKSIPNPLAAAD
jgi:hypothetical protein